MPLPLVRLRARLRAVRMLQPLTRRDDALLTLGSFISLLGGVRDPELQRVPGGDERVGVGG